MNRSFIEYYDNEETYRKGTWRSTRSASLKNVTITSRSREGLDNTKGGYYFTVTILNDGDVIEVACQSVIARNKWVRMINNAVRSLEGSNTLSEACFIKLIESQLKVERSSQPDRGGFKRIFQAATSAGLRCST